MRNVSWWSSIACFVTIGAAAVVLWKGGSAERASAPLGPAHGATLKKQVLPASGASKNDNPVHAPAPAPQNTMAQTHNDATYDNMLSYAQLAPDSPNSAAEIIREHEEFLSSPDDPEWGRRTERELRSVLQAKALRGGPEITSVSCRSAGCEVQALSRPFCGGAPCELVMMTQREDAGGPPVPINADLFEALRGDWPGDLPLKRQRIIDQRVGDRLGLIVTYSREARKPDAPP
jgi:hypothetical protein